MHPKNAHCRTILAIDPDDHVAVTSVRISANMVPSLGWCIAAAGASLDSTNRPAHG